MASNRIKGITIEIGGDTTKLDKALAGTNKEIKTTQANLKDVERLLKMDPGNTELLAQKQRLLAEAMEGTKKKAETLREAVSNADAALARGQDFNSKYAPLLESLDEASAAYEKLKSQKAEMDRQMELGDISTEAYGKWNAELEESANHLKDLRKQVADAKDEMGGPMMDQAQFDALQRELIESENAAQQAAKAFESYSQSAELVSANADKVAQGASKVADATKGISTAAGVAAGALVGLAVNAGKTADDLNTLSKQSGFSTETLQEWTYAADLVDVSVDDIIGAARKMKKNMVSESAETQAAFAQLGVSVYDSSGQIRDATDVFYQLLDGLSKVSNETERDILAMQIFGKSADELAGIIDDGGAALRQLGDEAKAAGLILSQDALDSANAFNDGLDSLKAKAQATFMKAGAELADTLLPALDSIVEALGGLLQWFAGLDSGTIQMLLSVLLAVAAIAPVAGAISSIATAVGAVSSAVGKLTGAIGGIGSAAGGALDAVGSLFMGPAGIALGAAAAAGALIYLYETNDTFRGALEDFDQWITGVFTTDWTESLGSMGEVVNAFFHSVQDIYEGIKRILGGIVDFVAGAFTGDWERAWQGVVDIFGGIFDTLEAIIKAPINGVIGLVNSMLQMITEAVNKVIGILNSISVDVPDWVPGVGGKTLGFNIGTITAPQIPYLARGTVTRPNSPFMAVVGDNPQEPEVISPLSTIRQAVRDVVGDGGQIRHVRVTVNFTGSLAQLVRMMQPEITAETDRLGPQFVK